MEKVNIGDEAVPGREFTKDMDKTRPIVPDYVVNVTYQDFLDGKDVFMETALKVIDSMGD